MSETKKSFVVFRENPTIFTLKFSPLNRESCDGWRNHVLSYNGKFPDPLRVLYDFTDCVEMPSPYVLSVLRRITPQLISPKNTRTAYLVPNKEFYLWANVFFAPMAARDTTKSFYKREDAVAWLMEGLATPEEASRDESEA